MFCLRLLRNSSKHLCTKSRCIYVVIVSKRSHSTKHKHSKKRALKHLRSKLKNNGDKLNVWIDCDTTSGLRTSIAVPTHAPDIDDGLAICALLYSNNCKIIGVSTVYGNDCEAVTYERTKLVLDKHFEHAGTTQPFPLVRGSKKPIKLFSGYASFLPEQKEQFIVSPNEAVTEMYDTFSKLDDNSVFLLAIGPLTNVAKLLLFYPEIKSKIAAVVTCTGRRTMTKPEFRVGTNQVLRPKPGTNEKGYFADFNFDLDPYSAQIIIQTGVPFIMGGFELSTHCWLWDHNLKELHANSEEGSLIHWLSDYETYKYWLNFWKIFGKQLPPWDNISINGFFPFDLMSASVLFAPDMIDFEVGKGVFVIGESDRDYVSGEEEEERYYEYYFCSQEEENSALKSMVVSTDVFYAKGLTGNFPWNGFKENLLELLKKPQE